MKKGTIFYRIVEKCETEWQYRTGDIIGVDNRVPVQVGESWFQIEKRRSHGRRYHTGGWISDLLHTYKTRYPTKAVARKQLRIRAVGK